MSTWRGQVPCHPVEVARCVYVEVPKAGCTSVKTALSVLKGGPPSEGEDIHGWMGYTHARNLGQLYDWLETRWSDLFRFTVVREPVERFLSFYYGTPEPYERGCYGDVNRYVCSGAFERDLEWRDDIHVIPQTRLIGTELERFDLVGRTEDMAGVQHKLQALVDVRVLLPHANRSTAARDEVTRETRERLRAIYRRDYEVLGYD